VVVNRDRSPFLAMTQLPAKAKRWSLKPELRDFYLDGDDKTQKDRMADVSVWVKSEQTSSERRINPNWSIAGRTSRTTHR